jgi:hypothetical protein
VVHCTQLCVAVLQWGVSLSEAQSASEAQVIDAQVFCGVQVFPAPQFAAVRQATQVCVSTLQYGAETFCAQSASALQPEAGALQVWSGWQVPPLGQSALARQATQAWGEAARSQRGVGAAQSASPAHCLITQVLLEVQTCPGLHCVLSRQATQVPPGLQYGAPGLEAQSLSEVQVVAAGCTQTFCAVSQTSGSRQSPFARHATQRPPGKRHLGVGLTQSPSA